MGDLFTVVDSAGKTRYEGDSLRDAHCIWHELAIAHELYMTDEQGDRMTDMDCGGGNTLFWDIGEDEAMVLFDTACERNACWDCGDRWYEKDMPPADDMPVRAYADRIRTAG